MNITAEKETAAIPEGCFDFTKIDLLQELLNTFSAFRKEFHKPDHQTLLLSIPTIASYIAFGTFESVLGLSSSRDWSLLNSRIRYLLDEKIEAEKRDKHDYLINGPTEAKIKALISGSNMRLDKTEKPADIITLNPSDYFKEQKVPIFNCKICNATLQPYERKPHLKMHTLKELLEVSS